VLVKTVRFEDYNYIGDPINTVRIFNELEVDELCFLDIRASYEKREPNFSILSKIANECFMPLAYGGGVNSLETAVKILSIGFEKIIINTAAYENPELVTKISEHVGNQSVIGSIDVRKNFFGNYKVYINDGKKKVSIDPIEYAQMLEAKGIGELLLTSMNTDGTWDGYDVNITKRISENVSVPVIANGGAGKIEHIGKVVKEGKADAVALGSMVVYQAKGMGVLVNFPDKEALGKELSTK
jgi:cyclase